MSNTQERIKKRREYLKKKREAYFQMSLPALLIMLLAIEVFDLIRYGVTVGKVLMVVAMLYLLRVLLASGRDEYQKAKQLTYIPPVTAATLPADEVLVRSSEEPKEEQGKVLLRGTDGSAGTGQQELLRADQQPERR